MSTAELSTAVRPEPKPAPMHAAAVAQLPAAHWKIGLFVVVMFLAFTPLLRHLAVILWAKPQHQFFPLVFVGALILARARLRGLGALTPGSRWIFYSLLTFIWTVLALGVALKSAWLGGVAALAGLLACSFGLGGARLARRMLPVWLFLWLAMSLPLGLDEKLVQALQPLATNASSRLLDLAGVVHVPEGNVVTIAGKRLFVDESCSGIQSLYSGLACTAFLVLWGRRGFVHGALLLASAVAWVLAANMGRVTFVALAEERWHMAASQGWRHEATGWLAFGIALALIASTDRLLLFLLGAGRIRSAEGIETASAEHDESERLPALRISVLPAWPLTAAFGALVLLQAAQLQGSGWQPDQFKERAETALAELDDSFLPDRAGPWRRVGFEVKKRTLFHQLGATSQIWHYQGEWNQLSIGLDYPFSE